MQDYSRLEKYNEAYKHFMAGTGHLVTAYAFIKESYDSNNGQLFLQGFEAYNSAIEEYKVTGTEYAKKYQ